MDHSPSTPIPFSDLPEGTVTFLFTDIEGSTRLLEQLREGYATLLADQRRILRGAFQKWHGHEVDTQGDSFFVAFGRAADAIACVIEAQAQALSEHTWPEGVTVRVRMGMHTGEPMVAQHRLRRHRRTPGCAGGGSRARRAGATLGDDARAGIP
jgi:class 3 adenylate cyclase